MSIMDLFDHYTEDDERRKMTASQRFEQTAALTFLSDVAATTMTRENWLPIRQLSNHMQNVLLKNVDADLHRYLSKRKIDPSLYALRWMRCLFSNVLSDQVEDGGEREGSGRSGVASTTPRAPLRHVVIVWDAMLGCRERVFDFVEAMCVSMLISMRTALLGSGENEILMLLMRYTLAGSVTELQTSRVDVRKIVQGLVSMSLEFMESPVWPKSNHEDVSKLMETVWGVPVDLQDSSAALRKQQEVTLSGDSKGIHKVRKELAEMMDVEADASSHSVGSEREFESEPDNVDSTELTDFRPTRDEGNASPRKRAGSKVELQYVDPESVSSEKLAASQMPSV
jgi:hypothetical protein